VSLGKRKQIVASRQTWTHAEEQLMIDYMKETAKISKERIEKPTQSIYWNKFLATSGVDRSLQQVKLTIIL